MNLEIKNIFLFVLLIFISTKSSGQDWYPFVINQNTYFQLENNGNLSIENFNCDSLHTSLYYDALYFNTKSEIPENCYPNVLNVLPNYTFNKPDSVLCYNDSIVIFSRDFSQVRIFTLKQNASLGEQWNTDGATITCSNIHIDSILGQQDSVKTFTCYKPGNDSVEFKLSKKYGLLRFKSFFSMFNSNDQYCELIGLENDSISIGYKQADFSDYFHLHEGDVLVWKDSIDTHAALILKFIKYHKDSIVSTYISTDSVFYEIFRQQFDTNAQLSNESYVNEIYLRKNIGKLIGSNLNYWNSSNKSNFWLDEIIEATSILLQTNNNTDSLETLGLRSSGYVIDAQDCSVGEIFDYSYEEKYNTEFGLCYKAEYGWGIVSSRIVGAMINNELLGDTTIYTGISSNPIINVNVYPTSFSDFIIIDIKNIEFYSLDFYNSLGQQIIFKQESNKLILTDLPQGIYFLKISDKKGNFKTIKLLKK